MASSQHKPALSIVIVNSNSADDTLRCIESIHYSPPGETYEIVLVDNCSHDDCIEQVKTRFTDVRTLTAPQRQGFSRNYNLGIYHAYGDYILVLNNDTLVQPGAIQLLIDTLGVHPEYGMVGPRLIWPNGRTQSFSAHSLPTIANYLLIQTVLDPAMPFGRTLQWIHEQRIIRLQQGPVPCISGACMLVTRAAIERAGLLDEGYEFYYEDAEWCRRFQLHGLVVAYVPESRVIHIGGQSSTKVKVWAKQCEYRSAIRYFQQSSGISDQRLRILHLATLIGFLVRGVLFLMAEALTGHRGHAHAYLYLFSWLLHEPWGNNATSGRA